MYEGRAVQAASHAYAVFVQLVGDIAAVRVCEVETYNARLRVARIERLTYIVKSVKNIFRYSIDIFSVFVNVVERPFRALT